MYSNSVPIGNLLEDKVTCFEISFFDFALILKSA
jgi:hypothetical protein